MIKTPWLLMWVLPKSTIRRIVEENPSKGITVLVTSLALENLFFFANLWSLGLMMSSFSIVVFALAFSTLLGYIWISIISRIFYYIGIWLGGSAQFSDVKAAIAWSKIPAIGMVASWLCILRIAPGEAFISVGGGNPLVLIFTALNFIFAIWSIILVIKVMQEVQKFSVARSILNILLSWAIFSMPFIMFHLLAIYIYRF